MTSRNAADQLAAAGCDAALQLRETALPLPSEQSRELIEALVTWAKITAAEDPFSDGPDRWKDTLYGLAAAELLALSTAHAEGLGKGDMASRADSAASLASELTDQQRGAPLEVAALQARIAELESENFALAAGVCEHRLGNEHGNAYCGQTGKLL